MWLIFLGAVVGLLWLLGGGASLNLGAGASSDGGSSDTGGSSSSSGSGDSMLRKLAQAIYDFEGSGPNTVATRNNNPGNMKPPDGSSNYWSGQVGVDSRGFAIFDWLDDGFTALMGDLTAQNQSASRLDVGRAVQRVAGLGRSEQGTSRARRKRSQLREECSGKNRSIAQLDFGESFQCITRKS